MSFLSLVSVEFKKIKRSKILLILLIATVILWIPSILNAQMNFDMQAEGNFSGKQFLYSGLYGDVMVYVPCKYGSRDSSFKSN